jgi:ABC-type transporter Mla subunit MlaD
MTVPQENVNRKIPPSDDAESVSPPDAVTLPESPANFSPPPLPSLGSRATSSGAVNTASQPAAQASCGDAALEPTPKLADVPVADLPGPAMASSLSPSSEAPSRRSARRRPAGPSRTQIAANDDAPSIGGLIFALHEKPSQRPMTVAAIASGVWAVLSILLGWAMLAPELQRAPTVLEMLTRPTAITLAATIVIPIALFWFIALLVWRAQELKLMSSAMTEVAIRLAEPDRMAEQQIASVGQAVRRQVNHMNEAVSRALGRAGELEALVHNEVASLERSYTHNENRIRTLLEELAGERNALLTSSERVSHSLRIVGADIPPLIDKLSEQQVKLARFIEEAGQNLVGLEQSLATNAAQLASSVGARTQELKSVLTDQGAELRELLDQRTSEIAAALTNGSERLEGALGGQAGTLERTLTVHAEQMETVFASFAGGLDGALGQRTEQLRQVLDATTEGLDSALARRSAEIERAVGDTATRLEQSLAEKGTVIARALEGAAERAQSALTEVSQSVDRALTQRTAGLQAVLEEYTRALDATLEARQQGLDQQLLARTKALDDAFSERLRMLDESIERSAVAIDSAVADKARAMSTALETHAREIAQELGQQAGQLDEQIMHGVHAVRRASENVTRQSVQAIEGLAGQADLLRNISDAIVQQIDSVTDRFDAQGQTIMQAARALETANQRIDTNLQQRQADLARTLDGLTAKAEDIDRVMRGYPASLDGTVNDFEARARVASEQFARGAEERARQASNEIERLKRVSASETERAVADLRSRFNDVTKEVSAEIGSLQSRFTESYDSMRQRARSTLADLEGEQARLRDELARLPEATRASAETVRQSLQEQLRALEQLSQLSNREAIRSDISQPAGLQPSPPSPAISSVSQSLANEIASRARVPQAAIKGNGEASRDGWKLGELLARASHEDGHPGDLDIALYARTLDQTTAAAIWSRFRAGQRGVMVRSIYAADGRAAFDDAQQRHAADPAFRQAVNRYISDFHRALRDAEQRDPTGRGAQALVTSDHGRAYLFLAHASGHLA